MTDKSESKRFNAMLEDLNNKHPNLKTTPRKPSQCVEKRPDMISVQCPFKVWHPRHADETCVSFYWRRLVYALYCYGRFIPLLYWLISIPAVFCVSYSSVPFSQGVVLFVCSCFTSVLCSAGVGLLLSARKFKQAVHTDYRHLLQKQYERDWLTMRIIVIIPCRDQDLAKLSDALTRLSECEMARQVCVLLAMEDSEEGAHDKASVLTYALGSHFHSVVATYHPDGISGELPGKSASIAWAFKEFRQFAEEDAAFKENRSLVLVMDAESRIHPKALSALSYKYLSTPRKQRNEVMWQMPIARYSNYFELPWMTRVAALMTTGLQLADHSIGGLPHLCSFPTSTYALAYRAAVNVNGWDTDVLVDDIHMLLKMRFYGPRQRVQVQPLFLPIITECATHTSTWTSHKLFYQYALKSACEQTEISYLLTGFAAGRIAVRDACSFMGKLIWSHFVGCSLLLWLVLVQVASGTDAFTLISADSGATYGALALLCVATCGFLALGLGSYKMTSFLCTEKFIKSPPETRSSSLPVQALFDLVLLLTLGAPIYVSYLFVPALVAALGIMRMQQPILIRGPTKVPADKKQGTCSDFLWEKIFALIAFVIIGGMLRLANSEISSDTARLALPNFVIAVLSNKVLFRTIVVCTGVTNLFTFAYAYIARWHRKQHLSMVEEEEAEKQAAEAKNSKTTESSETNKDAVVEVKQDPLPMVTVVLPTKGCAIKTNTVVDNWKSFIANTETYGGVVEFIFVLEDDTDSVIDDIYKLKQDIGSRVGIRVVFSGKATYSQKTHNLLCGVEQAHPDSKFVLFTDSNIKMHPTAITDDVKVFTKDTFCVSGFPVDFVHPDASVFSYAVCALRHGGPLTLCIYDGTTDWVWGGHMLMRTSDLRGDNDEVKELRDGLKAGLGDDVSIQHIAHKRKLKIKMPRKNYFRNVLRPQNSFRNAHSWIWRTMFVLRFFSNFKEFAAGASVRYVFMPLDGVCKSTVLVSAFIALVSFCMWPASVIAFPLFYMWTAGLVVGNTLNCWAKKTNAEACMRMACVGDPKAAAETPKMAFWPYVWGMTVCTGPLLLAGLFMANFANYTYWANIKYEVAWGQLVKTTHPEPATPEFAVEVEVKDADSDKEDETEKGTPAQLGLVVCALLMLLAAPYTDTVYHGDYMHASEAVSPEVKSALPMFDKLEHLSPHVRRSMLPAVLRTGEDPMVMEGAVGTNLKVIIASGTLFEVPVAVEEGTFVRWRAELDSLDIGFSATVFSSVTQNVTQLARVREVAGYSVVGNYTATEPGILSLGWNNEYSFLTSKHLVYSVEVFASGQKVSKGSSVKQLARIPMIYAVNAPGAEEGEHREQFSNQMHYNSVSNYEFVAAAQSENIKQAATPALPTFGNKPWIPSGQHDPRPTNKLVEFTGNNGKLRIAVPAHLEPAAGLMGSVFASETKVGPRDVADILSHLSAVRAAYMAGHPVALIVEDDLSLRYLPDWGNFGLLEVLNQLAGRKVVGAKGRKVVGAKDWEVVQLSIAFSNRFSAAQLASKLEARLGRGEFVSPYDVDDIQFVGSTTSYLVSRKGMESLMDKYWPGGAAGAAVPLEDLEGTIHLKQSSVAGVLYDRPNSFLVNRPLFTSEITESTKRRLDSQGSRGKAHAVAVPADAGMGASGISGMPSNTLSESVIREKEYQKLTDELFYRLEQKQKRRFFSDRYHYCRMEVGGGLPEWAKHSICTSYVWLRSALELLAMLCIFRVSGTYTFLRWMARCPTHVCGWRSRKITGKKM